MTATLPPGIGNPEQASQATAYIREQPWYQELVQSWGIDPTDVDENGNLRQKLTEDQEQQVLAAAQENGIGISDDSYHIDENGQIAKNDSHWLRNALIGAGIGAAALTGFGVAGIGPMAGMFGASADAAASASPFIADLGAVSPAEFAGGAASVMPTLGGVAGAVGTAGKVSSTLGKIGGLLGDAGKAVGAATTAAGNNALNQEELGLRAAGIDISGQQAYTNEEIAVANENAARENQHLKDQYMAEKAAHPSVSPFDITGGPKYSPEYLSTLKALAAEAPEQLKAPTPYKPITPSGAQKATGTTPSTMQTIGNWLSPALTVAPKIAAMF